MISFRFRIICSMLSRFWFFCFILTWLFKISYPTKHLLSCSFDVTRVSVPLSKCGSYSIFILKTFAALHLEPSVCNSINPKNRRDCGVDTEDECHQEGCCWSSTGLVRCFFAPSCKLCSVVEM